MRFPRMLASGHDNEEVDGVLSVPAVFMTLAFYMRHGWKVFGVGDPFPRRGLDPGRPRPSLDTVLVV